jgi:hypothetical protein
MLLLWVAFAFALTVYARSSPFIIDSRVRIVNRGGLEYVGNVVNMIPRSSGRINPDEVHLFFPSMELMLCTFPEAEQCFTATKTQPARLTHFAYNHGYRFMVLVKSSKHLPLEPLIVDAPSDSESKGEQFEVQVETAALNRMLYVHNAIAKNHLYDFCANVVEGEFSNNAFNRATKRLTQIQRTRCTEAKRMAIELSAKLRTMHPVQLRKDKVIQKAMDSMDTSYVTYIKTLIKLYKNILPDWWRFKVDPNWNWENLAKVEPEYYLWKWMGLD